MTDVRLASQSVQALVTGIVPDVRLASQSVQILFVANPPDDTIGIWGADIGLVPTNTMLSPDPVTHQGLFYWIGRDGGTTAWANPHTSGRLTVTQSTNQGAPHTPAGLVNRANASGSDVAHTQSNAGSWMRIDLAHSVRLTGMSIAQRNDFNGHFFRQLIVEGSNDGTTWTTIADIPTVSLTVSQGAWSEIAITSSVFYRKFRVVMQSTDSLGGSYFCVGELELYGEVAAPTLANSNICKIDASALTGLADGATLPATIVDSSGAGNTATRVNSPTYQTAETPNGGPAMRSSNGYLSLPSGMWTGATAGHIFVYVKGIPGAGVNVNGPWHMGSDGEYSSHYPYSDNLIMEGALSASNQTRSVITPSMNVRGVWRVYEVEHSATTRIVRIDGVQQASAAKTFGPSTTLLRILGNNWLRDDNLMIAEFLAYNRVLTVDEATAVRSYLTGKYGATG